MPMQISKAQMEEVYEKGKRLMARARGMADKSEAIVERVVQTAEVQVGAFTFGVINGRFNAPEIAGVPADLGAGLGLHLMSFAGLGGAQSKHMQAFGDGALASYFTNLGNTVGSRMRQRAGTAATPAASPAALTPGGATAGALTDSEVAKLAQAAAART